MSAIFLRGDNGTCDSLVDAVGSADVSIDGVETVQEWLGARKVAERAGRGEKLVAMNGLEPPPPAFSAPLVHARIFL